MKPKAFEEHSLAEWDAYLAAQARQLFRAAHAKDKEAVSETIDHLGTWLACMLNLLLQDDPQWEPNTYFLDNLAGAPFEFRPPCSLRVRDRIWIERTDPATGISAESELKYVCMLGDREPFELELELRPQSGAFHGCIYRFGDRRRLVDLTAGTDGTWPADDGWAFVYSRGAPLGRNNSRDENVIHHLVAAYADEDDHLIWFSKLIAVSTRNLIRAQIAADADGLAVSMQKLQHFLMAAVAYQLRSVQAWARTEKGPDRWIRYIEERHIDTKPTGIVSMRGSLVWHDHTGEYAEPFECVVELDRQSGEFRRYRARFGDDRPLEQKRLRSGTPIVEPDPTQHAWPFCLQLGEVD